MSINQQQFTIWHAQYRPRLLNSITAVVRDRDIAEDVAAAALAAAWRNLNQFRGDASLIQLGVQYRVERGSAPPAPESRRADGIPR